MSVFSDAELEYLAGQPLGRIATAQPDGTLQVSPVSFHHNPEFDSIDIAGHRMVESRKFKNIADNSRVAFVVDDLGSQAPWRPRCVEIRGRGEAIADSPRGPIIRIIPQRIISFGIEEDVTSVSRLAVNARDV